MKASSKFVSVFVSPSTKECSAFAIPFTSANNIRSFCNRCDDVKTFLYDDELCDLTMYVTDDFSVNSFRCAFSS